MTEDYEKQLGVLRDEIRAGALRPSAIDIGVAELLQTGNSSLPKDLLSLLSDDAKFDEGMFSLIHAAESFEDAKYVSALLNVFPDLLVSAPRWASIVLMRVLNSDSARAELVRQLREASPSTKKPFHTMCERIAAVSPVFLSKTIAVSLATT